MNRNESTRLGDLQAEGNLGNERNRNSDIDRSRESGRNRSGEGSMRERSRESEDRESGEDWSPSDMHDNSGTRSGGRDR